MLNEACRLGKSFVCKKCGAINNFDLATELKINRLKVGGSCPSCGKEFEVSLNSFMENSSVNQKIKENEKENSVELRESSRFGKSVICNSCGSSFDFDVMTDSNIKFMSVNADCPNCLSKITLSSDSFLNNRSILFEETGSEEESEEAEPQNYGARYGEPAHSKSKKKEDVNYIR